MKTNYIEQGEKQTKKEVFGFMYRGNGYGFWDTVQEARRKATDKMYADKSDFVWRYGAPEPTIWTFSSREYAERFCAERKMKTNP